MKSDDDDKNPVVISYFCSKNNNDPPITGKVFEIKPTEFIKQVDISWAFAKIKERITIKSGDTRKKMLDLKDYEVYDWAALLHYLRQSWCDGEKYVYLSWKEFKMLEG